MSSFDYVDLVGRSLLKNTEDGQRIRVKIVRVLDDYEEDLNKDPTRREFVHTTNEDQGEETLSYNETLELVEDQQEDEMID